MTRFDVGSAQPLPAGPVSAVFLRATPGDLLPVLVRRPTATAATSGSRTSNVSSMSTSRPGAGL